jgi:hypothetical protein
MLSSLPKKIDIVHKLYLQILVFKIYSIQFKSNETWNIP